MGAFGGVIFPALAVLLAAWVPEKERGKLGSLAFSGSQVRIDSFSVAKSANDIFIIFC